ncbi:dTDP-4-dehydrorhamnose 3,5-epimerase [Porphyromonadaceae bacterium COT-184 OH4590]|nr:dTDP-4-dehydrorhamnose 3,5-epimerase [Porphyromonadaceae bacterium COT-184 OH4590]
MEITTTPIKDLIIIKPDVFADTRGYFTEIYNESRYKDSGITQNFIQDNLSKSCYGVVRGLHFQKGEYAQAKLVKVICGKVWDVAVDLRPTSDTYGKWFGVELSEENHLQFLIPRGFAHGFSVLSPMAIFSYKCDNLYNKQSEAGIIYNDPTLNIDWKVPNNKMIVSEKDLTLPNFMNI